MAFGKLAPKNGSLSIAGVGGDLTGFDVERRQQVDDVTGYTETVDADHAGSGCFATAIDFNGFAGKGASGASPGLGAMSDAIAAIVATLDTGCTYTFNAILESIRISHRKLAGGVPFSGRAHNKLTVTEAWVTS